jgi:hypothetical protein
VLLQEAQKLVSEDKSWDAVFLYQGMLQGDPGNGRAHLALLELLKQVMQHAVTSPGMEDLGLAVSIYQKVYPDLPLPPEVEARLGKK